MQVFIPVTISRGFSTAFLAWVLLLFLAIPLLLAAIISGSMEFYVLGGICTLLSCFMWVRFYFIVQEVNEENQRLAENSITKPPKPPFYLGL